MQKFLSRNKYNVPKSWLHSGTWCIVSRIAQTTHLRMVFSYICSTNQSAPQSLRILHPIVPVLHNSHQASTVYKLSKRVHKRKVPEGHATDHRAARSCAFACSHSSSHTDYEDTLLCERPCNANPCSSGGSTSIVASYSVPQLNPGNRYN